MLKLWFIVCYYNMHVHKLISVLGEEAKELETVIFPLFRCYKDEDSVAY